MEVSFLHAVVYLVFFCLLFIAKKRGGLRLFDDTGFAVDLPMLMILHISGIILFGVLPFLFHQPTLPFWDNPSGLQLPVWVSWMLVILLLILSPRIAAKKFSHARLNWNSPPGSKYITLYFFVRILFIASYEYWFRGYLLTDAVTAVGVLPTIAINVFFYALLHWVNGRQEMIGCFPFGVLLCSLCIWLGAAWPAILLHLALTIPYEITFLQKIKKAKTSAIESIHHRRIGLSW